MMKGNVRKIAIVAAGAMALATVASPQLKQAIKILGVGAIVHNYGKEMNKAINRIADHTDTNTRYTKVVPILTVGVGTSHAIGAAQVMGPRNQVEKVEAVAQPAADLFGKEVRVRALIPVSSRNVIQDIKKVDGVGVSGIVDIKL